GSRKSSLKPAEVKSPRRRVSRCAGCSPILQSREVLRLARHVPAKGDHLRRWQDGLDDRRCSWRADPQRREDREVRANIVRKFVDRGASEDRRHMEDGWDRVERQGQLIVGQGKQNWWRRRKSKERLGV